MPTLEEAPRSCKGVAVDDLGLGQVHLMACGPHMQASILCLIPEPEPVRGQGSGMCAHPFYMHECFLVIIP